MSASKEKKGASRQQTSALSEFFVSDDEQETFAGRYQSDPDDAAAHQGRMLELLAFCVADETYALDIDAIQEIIKVPTITELPRVGPETLGVISLRGTIVPLLDLRRVLGLECRELSREVRILVLRPEDDPVGLLVDRVTSVVRIERDSVQPAPVSIQREGSDRLFGVGRVDGHLLIILDAEAVLAVMDEAG